MHDPSAFSALYPPIGGCFVVDPARPLPGAGGGLPAFGATDLRVGRTDLMAVAVARDYPARAGVMRDLTEGCANLLGPLGCGPGPGSSGEPAYYVVCPAPPGPALTVSPKPWSEAALIAMVLRPVAQVLCHLAVKGVTHRAIRPDNVFTAGPGKPVSLGCAWAAPPALHQPAAYEPFYSLMCLPAGRGNGTPADDVYALGCLLIALACGVAPLSGLDNPAVLRRKLDVGSFAALAGDLRLPPIIGDLARGMLAEDPDHRPTPAMLLDPAAARGRRVAARPPRRAQRGLAIGGMTAWDARTLGHAVGAAPEDGVRALRDGTVTHWLRRGLGDAALCAGIDDIVRQNPTESTGDKLVADALLTMRVVGAIEPLAPLFWRGIALWPDGLGPAIAAAKQDPATLGLLEEIIATEAIGAWAAQRADRCDAFGLRAEARGNRGLLRARFPAGGMARLSYALNPLLPCGGGLAGSQWVCGLGDVAPVMEAMAQSAGDPCDADVVAFIAARSSQRLDIELNALATHSGPGFPVLPWLRILARLQGQYTPRPLPGLARRMAEQAGPLVARWRNREHRSAVELQLVAVAEAGLFAPMIALLDDTARLEEDAAGAIAAAAEAGRIDAILQRIEHGAQERAALSMRYGQEIAAGLGLTALAITLVLAIAG